MRTARTLKAIIFDFDGVLADSEPLHLRGFQTVLLERGIDLSEQDYTRSYVGLADHECFKAVFLAHKRSLPEHELHDLLRRKSAWMLRGGASLRRLQKSQGEQLTCFPAHDADCIVAAG